ncbi:period circadian [Fusarium bulbicola]|nr:period circadian [Fusarium bulbicola]
MSGLINKVKEAIHSDKDKSHEQPEGTHGGHSSRVANAADPRYDSDRDHRANPGTTTTGGLGSSTHNTGTAGGLTGGSTYSENMPGHATSGRTENMPGHTTAGGLGSHGGLGGTSGGLSGNSGTYGQTTTGTSGLSSHGAGTQGGIGGTSAGYSTGPGNTAGPHSSDMANKLDPKVDSDLDGSRRLGGSNTHGNQSGLSGNSGTYGQTTTGTSGFSSHGAGAHGPTHTSGLSGTGSTGTYGSTTGTGPGPAPKTAGPHSSDMANKLDPRVDSDLDGSKTVGQEKTVQQSNNNFAGRDPTDATQVPPSVLQKHVPTEIAHDDPHSDHSRRHSSTHQETHRGL